jgi:hypothetical protein
MEVVIILQIRITTLTINVWVETGEEVVLMLSSNKQQHKHPGQQWQHYQHFFS